jgi:transglutaminase-like putative cysteine protease
MSAVWTERVKLAALGWLSVVLTSLSFFPALEDKSYLPKAALMSALLIGLGVALRSLRLPGWAVFVVQVIALFELFLLRYGEDRAYGVLPTRASLDAIDVLVRDGFDTAQQFAAPAPPNTGLLMMVLFAICLVAICVDAVALGLGRVPLAGLPLLALYTIPVAALPDGVPFYAFVPGAAAYIAMITSDERDRLAHWGRLVSRNSAHQEPSEIDTSGLHATGRQVSFLALTVAVILPVFIPALSSSILDGGSGEGDGIGDGRVLSFDDPLVSLKNALHREDPVDILEIDTGDNVDPQYVRLVALNNPGPDAWTADSIDLGTTHSLSTPSLPRPTGETTAVNTRGGRYDVRLLDGFPTDSNWLPVPFGLQAVTIDAPFGYVSGDQTVTAREDDAIDGVTSYNASFAKPVPTAKQLQEAGSPPADIVTKYGEVPDGVPDVVRTQAESVTAGAENEYDQAVALQAWFRRYGKFSYDLNVGYGAGYDAMADFLSEQRGFCQQYAATMAMMARELQIPSRVVVGLLKPAGPTGTDGAFKFTSDAMHAWPELYFEGVGWVQFEPTPGLAAPYPLYAGSEAGDPPTGAPTQTQDTSTAAAGRETTDASAAATPDEQSGSGGSGGPSALLSTRWLIVLAVVALLFLPAGLRHAVRRSRLNRPLDPGPGTEAAWQEVRDHLRDLRLPWTGSMTPRARERDVAVHLAGHRDGLDALHRLAMAVERARYSARPTGDSVPADDARTVIAAANAASDTTERVKAFFWPTSLMPDIRRGWASLRARLRRRARLT